MEIIKSVSVSVPNSLWKTSFHFPFSVQCSKQCSWNLGNCKVMCSCKDLPPELLVLKDKVVTWCVFYLWTVGLASRSGGTEPAQRERPLRWPSQNLASISFLFLRAGDGAQDLAHVRQVLWPWAPPSAWHWRITDREKPRSSDGRWLKRCYLHLHLSFLILTFSFSSSESSSWFRDFVSTQN